MFEHFGHNPKNMYQPFWTSRALPERSEARKMSIFGDSRRWNPTRGGCANQPSANPVRISGVTEESLCTRLSISNGLREFIHNFVIRLFCIVYTRSKYQGVARIWTQSAREDSQSIRGVAQSARGDSQSEAQFPIRATAVRATSPYQSKRNPRAGSFVLLSTNYASSGLPVRSSYAWRYFSIVLSTISCGSVQSLSGLALSQSLANCLSNDGWL